MTTKTRRLIATILSGLLPFGMAAAALVAGITYEAPQGGYGPQDSAVVKAWMDSIPVNVPTFAQVKGTDLAAGCVAPEAWTASVKGLAKDDPARMPAGAIIVTTDGTAHRVSITEAWDKVKAAPKSTVWVIGACR